MSDCGLVFNTGGWELGVVVIDGTLSLLESSSGCGLIVYLYGA